MPRLTSTALAKPWVLAASVALVGAAGTTTAVVSSHTQRGVRVRVLGERFQASSSSQTGAGASTASTSGGTSAPTGPVTHGRPNLTFTLTASVTGLIPGQPVTLPVQITNPTSNGGTLTINSINVVAHDITQSGSTVCAASNVSVTSYDSTRPGSTAYAITKGGTATIPLPILLQDFATVNETPCEGKSFSLNVSGTGTVTTP
jgi:hypothetical protein